MKSFFLIGSSHLIALIDAATRNGPSGGVRQEENFNWREVAFRRYDFNIDAPAEGLLARMRFVLLGGGAPALLGLDANGQPALEPSFLEELRDAVRVMGGVPDTVVSYFHGNEHSIFSMVEHPQPFDVSLGPDDPPAPSARGPRQVIAREVVRRELAQRAHLTVLYCQMLRRLFPGSEVVHLMAPPPIGDENQLRSNPEIFEKHFQLYGVAPRELRLKIYTLYQEVLAEGLKGVDVRLHGAPAQSHENGFLKQEAWMEATHANHRYGQWLLNELGAA